MAAKRTEGSRRLVKDRLRKILVVGVGNEYRSDDGVGILIAREIREKHLRSVTVKEESGEGTALMEAWKGFKAVILIDAISSASKPGTIVTIDARKKTVPAKFFHYSTHAFSVAEAIELARVLKTLPPQVFLFGIEGASFHAGVGLSRMVQESAKNVVSQIVQCITMVVKV
jgi:hydrogenase maturation protease